MQNHADYQLDSAIDADIAALQAEADSIAAKRAAEASAADLSRTRSDHGTMAVHQYQRLQARAR